MELSRLFTGPDRWEAFDEVLKEKSALYEIKSIACSTTPEGEQALYVEFGAKPMEKKKLGTCSKCGQQLPEGYILKKH